MGATAAQVRVDARAALLAQLAAAADGALVALARDAPPDALAGLDGAGLLQARAELTGRTAGDSCRLLQAADGWLAVNLPRPDDWDLLPAWLEADGVAGWDRLAAVVRERGVVTLAERGRLLGLAVAPDAEPVPAAPWTTVFAPSRAPAASDGNNRRRNRPRVVDLSSLWAGPLCGHLLQRLGAQVIKVESVQRPDGARRGPPAFFEWLNAGKANVSLDFAAAAGRRELSALLRNADIVIESSRPRALRQLGIVAEDVVRDCGTTWVSITGYGRGRPHEDWVAYGDDAAVAAGLSRRLFEATGERALVGDAVADPLSGVHAALAAWRGHRAGGSRLVSVALRDVVRNCLAGSPVPVVVQSCEAGAGAARETAVQAEGAPP